MSTITNERTRIGFGGKIDNFDSKEERSIEQKHLKAYMKGHTQFRHGFHTDNFGKREPTWYEVKTIFSELKTKNK